MRPRRRQPRAGECVEDEPPYHDEQSVPNRAAGGLQDQQDGEDTEHEVQGAGHNRPIDEAFEVDDHVAQRRPAGQGQDRVGRMNPPRRAFPAWIDEERQEEDEEQMDRAMDLRDHGGGRGPEVVEGHHHQDGGDEASDQTWEVPGLALKGLDELLDFLRGLRQLARRRLGHGLGATAIVNRVPSPAMNRGSSLLPTPSRGRPVWPTRSTISRRRAEPPATRNAPSRRYGALRPL